MNLSCNVFGYKKHVKAVSYFHCLHNIIIYMFYTILLIAAKFVKVGPTFDPFPSILDRFSAKGLHPDFFTIDAFFLGLFLALLKKVSETLVCNPCRTSKPSSSACLRLMLQSSNSCPHCLEKAHCDGLPWARFLRTERTLRTRTEHY